jgi:hypothetical protein
MGRKKGNWKEDLLKGVFSLSISFYLYLWSQRTRINYAQSGENAPGNKIVQWAERSEVLSGYHKRSSKGSVLLSEQGGSCLVAIDLHHTRRLSNNRRQHT